MCVQSVKIILYYYIITIPNYTIFFDQYIQDLQKHVQAELHPVLSFENQWLLRQNHQYIGHEALVTASRPVRVVYCIPAKIALNILLVN